MDNILVVRSMSFYRVQKRLRGSSQRIKVQDFSCTPHKGKNSDLISYHLSLSVFEERV
jgi:hypothetical protein